MRDRPLGPSGLKVSELGLASFISEQPPYSIFDRRAEGTIFAVCRRHGPGMITWSPLNFGRLSGKYRRGRAIDPDSRAATKRTMIHQPESPEGQRKLDLVEGCAAEWCEAAAVPADGGALTTSPVSGARSRAAWCATSRQQSGHLSAS
jgi:aryl-alcohol dehydrogenase-like predicted oxidoreductase